ncbi:MAG: hypothetical protein D8M22_03480 [Armatimonadetes bacterium]|nr:hypothetical protein [Armatimonadota bacterium]GIK32056.1 MAG: hypothetical protein BroJett009_10480 [Armatimonadota bacterium]
MDKEGRFIEIRPITQGTTDLDIAVWQAQGPEAIFRGAWELVVTAHELKGGTADELRLQRTAFSIGEAPR